MPKAIIKFPETPPVWDSDLMATVDKEIGPDFTDDPLIKRYNMFFGRKLQGKRYTLTMSSKDSTIYPGIATTKGALEQLEKVAEDHEIHGPLGGVERFKVMGCNASTPDITKPQAYKRRLHVFVPAGVDPQKASPFMIFLDGVFQENMGEAAPFFRFARKLCCCCCPRVGGTTADSISYLHTMDHLFQEKQLSPIVCIFLDPGPQNETCIWGTQRNLEYDTVSNTFTDFVEQEVLPFVSKKCGVLLATDPDQRAVMGTSSGGNAAITMGLTGRFRRVLTSSPSCVNVGYPYDPEVPLHGWDYHSGKELIKSRDKVEGLRVVVVTNELDLCYQSDVKDSFNWTAAALRTAKALKEKGYDCLHIFANQGIHVDPRALAQCFPDAVRWVWSAKAAALPAPEEATSQFAVSPRWCQVAPAPP